MNLLENQRLDGCANTASSLTINRIGAAIMADASNNDSVEIWKPIPGWEGLYEASSLGRIRSLPRLARGKNGIDRRLSGKVLAPGIGTWGYQNVALKAPGKPAKTQSVHRLVCAAFHGAPMAKMDAAHADGVRTNNKSDNLRWATRSENHADKRAHGTINCGSEHHNAKLDEDKVRQIRSLHAAGESQSQIARDFGLDQSNVHYIVQRKTWTHI